MLQDKIIEIFIKADDFCKIFEKEIKQKQISTSSETITRNRKA